MLPEIEAFRIRAFWGGVLMSMCELSARQKWIFTQGSRENVASG